MQKRLQLASAGHWCGKVIFGHRNDRAALPAILIIILEMIKKQFDDIRREPQIDINLRMRPGDFWSVDTIHWIAF